ncbi:MAG: hypothetical protein M3P23_15615, partial [Actinomycetota bacterium]|nr:hypothetical protein [Actinomycetota bacterium]
MTDPVRRVHYFFGQLLTSDDLQTEQDYHREMRYLHNRLLGHGVVHGLDVTVGDGSTVVVSPGIAIDPCGREIVLADEVHIDLRESADPDGSLDLTATWDQEPDSFVVSIDQGGGEAAFSRWLERPRLALVPPGEAPAESVVLGRILLSAGEVTAVDLGERSTWRRAKTGKKARS